MALATLENREDAAYVGGFEITILRPAGKALIDVPIVVVPEVNTIFVLFIVEKSMFSLKPIPINVLIGTPVALFAGPVEVIVGAAVSTVSTLVVRVVGVPVGVFALYPICPDKD